MGSYREILDKAETRMKELEDPARHPHLAAGGVLSAALSVVLAGTVSLGQVHGVVPPGLWFHCLAAGKVAVALLGLVGLRQRTGVLPAVAINVLGDLALITAALHLTGGAVSPLFAILVVYVVIVGLVANAPATILTACAALVFYTGMVLGVHLELLPAFHPPVRHDGRVGSARLTLDLLFSLCAIGIPAVVVALFLRRLRDRTQELARRTAQLEEEGRRRNQLMATLTHELRNPIHGICGLADLLTTQVYGEMTERQEGAVRQIRGSADGLLTLINDHLQMAQDDAGRLELRLGDVALEELVPTVAASLAWMLETKHVKLETEVEPELPSLRSDRGKLTQVLVNLMTNAVKYTPDGGRVQVLVRRMDSARVSISVRDTGEGIAEKDLDRIFDAFHQVGGGAAGGVGLGLSLVRRLIHLLGGEIQVGSQFGRGTTFVVTLPVNVELRREASDPEQRAIEARGAVQRKARLQRR